MRRHPRSPANQGEAFTPRELAEMAVLNDRLSPGHLREEVWPRLMKDDDFREVGHEVLRHATERAPGSDPVAMARYEGILEGAALAGKALLGKSAQLELEQLLAGSSTERPQ